MQKPIGIAGEVERHQSTGSKYNETFPYFVGAQVIATQSIVEENFPEKGTVHTHASRGDTGTVVFIEHGEGPGICTGMPTVRFHDSGTATLAFEHEIEGWFVNGTLVTHEACQVQTE
jgi:hypothetical protein